MFVDVRGVHVARDARRTQKFTDGFVRQIRVGERPDATRIVLDLDASASHSVFTLYNPFRVVIDCERGGARPVLASSRYRVHAWLAPRAPRGRAVAARLLAHSATARPAPRHRTPRRSGPP